MGVPIPVGASPQLISRSVAKPYLIYNQGQSTVYIGLDSSVSSGNFAFPLAAGNAMQWSELSSDVYAVCAAGQSSTVVIAPEASALALGAVSANIQGTVPVQGSVDVPAGVGINGTVTTKIANPVLLDQVTTAFGTAAITAQPIYNPGSWLLLAGYSSVMVTITGGYGTGTTPAVTFANYLFSSLGQSGSGFLTSQFKPEWLLDGSMTHSVILPVTALQFFPTIWLTKLATTLGGSITVSVYGLSTPVAEPVYVSQSPQLQGTIPFGGVWSYTNNNTASNVFYLASKNNAAQFSIYGSGSAGFSLIEAIEGGTSKGLVALYTSASASGAFAALKLPQRPVRVTTQMTTPTAITSLLQG